jgi:hypothetical protein
MKVEYKFRGIDDQRLVAVNPWKIAIGSASATGIFLRPKVIGMRIVFVEFYEVVICFGS